MRKTDEILEAHREELEAIFANWRARTAGMTAIEAAREFGVDIEHLRYMRQLTPTERLRSMQDLVDSIAVRRPDLLLHKDLLELLTFRAIKNLLDEEPDDCE
ncbi:MAG: hypothetical protein HY260_03805 [Chloroflexi bacterium]|nr:hypothetical protein [Chloroflexota bacterium]